MVYCDDTCVLGVLGLAQYTHMKYVVDATEMNVSVVRVCMYMCVSVCVSVTVCVYLCIYICLCV